MREEWEKVKLGDLLDKIIGGGTPSKSKEDYWNGEIPWCSVKDMADDKFVVSQTEDRITVLGVRNSSTNLIPEGTVITATRMGLGRAFISGREMAINQDLKALIPNSRIYNKFLLWLIVSNRENLDSLGTGSTVKGIRLETLRGLNVDLPPLPTQRKIATILSAYDDLIENNLKRIKLLEEKAQLTYEEWFVRLKFPGLETAKFDEESGLPEGWLYQDMESVLSFRVDNRGRNPQYYCEEGIPVLDNHLITNSPYVNLKNAKRFLDESLFDNFLRKYLEPGDVLITLVGTVGSISLAPKEKCAIIQNTIGLRCNDLCNQYYLFWFLMSNKQAIMNQNRGSAQPSVKVGDLLSLKMLLPDSHVMKTFKAFCKPLFDQINNLGHQNQLLKEARDILLPRLMSGMIDV